MRNASGYQCKVKMSVSEKKVNENSYDISSIKRVSNIRSFWKLYVVVVQNKGKEMYKKSVSCTCKVAFFANKTYHCSSPFTGVAFVA